MLFFFLTKTLSGRIWRDFFIHRFLKSILLQKWMKSIFALFWKKKRMIHSVITKIQFLEMFLHFLACHLDIRRPWITESRADLDIRQVLHWLYLHNHRLILHRASHREAEPHVEARGEVSCWCCTLAQSCWEFSSCLRDANETNLLEILCSGGWGCLLYVLLLHSMHIWKRRQSAGLKC